MDTIPKRLRKIRSCMVCLTLVGCTSAPAQEDGLASLTPEQREARTRRFDELRGRGAEASITIYPVVMPDVGESSTEIRDVVGLLLEQAGFKDLATADTLYRPTGALGAEQVAAEFGAMVRQHKIGSGYALYVSLGGTYESGPDEIIAVVTDANGEVVWTLQVTSDDREFRKMKPKEPMTCCNLMTERFRKAVDMSGPKHPNGDGYFAKLWRSKSGVPDKAELAAMEGRLAAFKASAPRATLIVFPIQIAGHGADRAAAEELRQFIVRDGLVSSTDIADEVSFDLESGSNEQKRLWDLARSFQARLKEHSITGDYALYAEYLMDPEQSQVGAVHFIVCDAQGDWVIVDFQNSHHGAFQSIDPQNVEDCNRLVTGRLAGYLK